MTRPALRRTVAAATLAILLAGGLVTHFAMAESTATDVAGDILYAAAVYTGLCLLAPRLSPVAVAAIAAGWGVAVEVFQLTGVPATLATAFPPAALVLGTVFDPRDLVIAAAVPVVAGVVDSLLSPAARHPSTDRGNRRRGDGGRR